MKLPSLIGLLFITDLAYDNFIDTVEQSYERCFPLQKVSRKRFKDKPWITSGLKKI